MHLSLKHAFQKVSHFNFKVDASSNIDFAEISIFALYDYISMIFKHMYLMHSTIVHSTLRCKFTSANHVRSYYLYYSTEFNK